MQTLYRQTARYCRSILSICALMLSLSFSALWRRCIDVAIPDGVDALREINATGHANKRASVSNINRAPKRQSRNSAASHVVMLKSCGMQQAA